MTKTTAENLRLGIFVVLGVVLLLVAAFLIGDRQNMFNKTVSISAKFKNTNGLQKGNNVRFSGINVGTVSGIEMVNDTTLVVSMVIDEKIQQHIKSDALVLIGSDGLVGSMLVNIVPGKGNAPFIKPGDVLQSGSRVETQDMLATLNVTNQNAAQLTADLLKITHSLTEGKGTMGVLLNDTVVASDLQQTVINLKQTITSLKSAGNQANLTMANLNTMVESIDLEESAAGVLLSDTVSANKIRSVITNLEASSNEITQMTNELNTVIVGLKDGEGLINYVSEDTAVVSRIENTMKSIEEGTSRFNENMEALKHNFLTRGYFRKLERKARKTERAASQED